MEPIIEGGLPPNLVDAWADFLWTNPEPGRDVYDEVFDHPTLFLLQRRREMAAMMRLARSIEPHTAAVVGADKGGDAFHFLRCLPTVERLIVCEIRGTPYSKAFTEYFDYVAFSWQARGSRDPETLREVAAFVADPGPFDEPPRPIDVLFLDGDKNAVTEDFEAYLPMMSHGGLVLIHDIVDEIEPRRVFAELGERYRTETIIDTTEGCEAVERAARGEPILTAHEAWARVWGESSCGVGVVWVP